MIRNVLLSALASLKRKKLVSVFTLLTISLGMTMIVLLASIYNSFTGNVGPYKQRRSTLYLSNMKFVKDGETVQRTRSKNATAFFIDQHLRTMETPELIGMYGRMVDWNLGSRYKPYMVKYLETDVNFWEIHKFTFLTGRPFGNHEVAEKQQVCILSEKAARYLFNEVDVTGKYYKHYNRNYRIVGVIKNEHPYFEVSADVYVPYTITIWGEERSYKDREGEVHYYNRGAYKGVLLISKNTSFSKVKKEFSRLKYKINQLGKCEEFDGLRSRLQSPGQLITALLFPYGEGVIIISILILLFLLIPVIILSNINFYALRNRIEEIGIRRSFGATQKRIVAQLIFENIILTLVGGIIAMLISLPLNNALAVILFGEAGIIGMQFNFSYLIILIFGVLLFGFITVVIPAYRISGMMPALAIHYQFKSQDSSLLFKSRKKWLLVLSHFLLFTVFATGTFFLSLIWFNSLSGVGYNPQNKLILMIKENGAKEYTDEHNRERYKGLKEKLLTIPEIQQVSYVLENPPSYIIPQYKNYKIGDIETKVRTLETDSDFFKLLNIKTVRGELYKADDGSFVPGIATLKTEQEYFEGNAMGKVIQRMDDGRPVKIVGVISKYKNHPAGFDFQGIFTLRNHPSRSVVIKYEENSNLGKLEDKVGQLINDNFENYSITQDANIEAEFEAYFRRTKPIYYGIMMSISFLLINAIFGFFTLIWYNVNSRKKELGIRRAVGANKNRVQKKILTENLLFMLIGAGISAFVLSQVFMQLLNDNRISYFWVGLFIAIVISFLMTFLSALIPSYNARKIQPIETLADE